MVLPAELKKKEFSKGFKGYNAAEVDEYVSYLLAKYSEAYRDYAELEKKYKAALVKLDEAKSDENAFSAMVLDAHKMADAIVSDANESRYRRFHQRQLRQDSRYLSRPCRRRTR